MHPFKLTIQKKVLTLVIFVLSPAKNTRFHDFFTEIKECIGDHLVNVSDREPGKK